jgi:S-adenosylmethionine uptake transporter
MSRQSLYLQGLFWYIFAAFISATNDALTSLLSHHLHGFEIAFFRFFFSMIILLPFVWYRGFHSLRMAQPSLHFLRAALGVAAVVCSVYSVMLLPLNMVTTTFFTQPLFVLVMAALILKEKVGFNRWLATLVGFSGIIIATQFQGTIRLVALLPIMGAILFGLQDILIKIMVVKEDRLLMLFHFATVTTLVALIPALWVWQTPGITDLLLLFLLGIGANLIQVFLFKAFAAAKVSALEPYRYIELIFSSTFGYLLYTQIPHASTFLGAALIIAAALYILRTDKTA